MTKITYKTGRTGWVHACYVPANRSEEARFGFADGVVIVVLLLPLAGLICALALR